jgi:hypothetical protein
MAAAVVVVAVVSYPGLSITRTVTLTQERAITEQVLARFTFHATLT